MQTDHKIVTNLAVSVYDLASYKPEQTNLFQGTKDDKEALTHAVDGINDRYGDFVITPALMMAMNDTIVDRIAFGGVKDLEMFYQEKTAD